MQVWRICKGRYAATAYSGEGSKLVPGRWHDGARMVYTASSIALASVEIFVNLNRDAEPTDLVCIGADVPDALVDETPTTTTLAWQDDLDATRLLGMQWLAERHSPALRVPSAAVARDWNVLLNPEHPDFGQITIHEAWAFRFDPRMFRHA